MIKFYFKFPYLKKFINNLILLFIILYSIFLPAGRQDFIHASVFAQTSPDWYMVGANPQRTSWVSEEVRGDLNIAWYHPIEPYIPYKIQPIASNGKIYVSTARGLYAFNASDGALAWVFPTELPLGNAPTIATVNNKSVAFTPGYDHKIYAIDALTGASVTGYTPYEAGAGFETNPVVVNNTIYAGNRDGYFYALDAVTGSFKWKFQTNGPILYSPAFKNNTLYFASQDMFAYAVNATTGTQIWKSAKFPGAGFYSYWPVIYTHKSTNKDYVIFTGGSNLRQSESWLVQSIEIGIFQGYNLPSNKLQTTSSPVAGDWASGTVTLDASPISNYFTNYPSNRTSFVLDITNGQEFTYTDPISGKPTYAPFAYSGVTRGGSKYPPLVHGFDGVFYQQTPDDFANWIHNGAPVGWKFGTQYISQISDWSQASDEPVAYSSGGKVLYWSLCCDRFARGFDITIPLGQTNRIWTYWNYSMANASNSIIPGYETMYDDGDSVLYNNMNGWQVYSGKNKSKNGIYGKHAMTQSPPIPYQGKLYFLRGNSLIAFSPNGTNPKTPLPLAGIVSAPSTSVIPSPAQLTQKLETEIQKMIAAGHLRPGYLTHAFSDQYANGWYDDEREFGEILDYFQNPSDTVYTLLLAYPYVSSATQTSIKTYLQQNYGPGKPYDFTSIVHIGYQNGANRQWSDIPVEATNKFQTGSGRSPWTMQTQPICGVCGYWRYFPPFNFYAAWKYAQIVGNNDVTTAKNIFNSMSSKIEAPPPDSWLIARPYFINQYAAGYYGYLQLKQLAGLGGDSTVQNYYNHMLSLRINNFSKDTVGWGAVDLGAINFRNLSVARNFMFMTPEIAEYMSQNIKSQVQTAVDEYQYVGPYWFVNAFDSAMREGTVSYLYNSPALFQAKALILKQPYNEVVKYLDVPAFEKGDLFYIQNLVAALEAPSDGTTPTPVPSPTVQPSPSPSYTIPELKTLLSNWLTSLDTNYFFPDGKVNALDASWVIKYLE